MDPELIPQELNASQLLLGSDHAPPTSGRLHAPGSASAGHPPRVLAVSSGGGHWVQLLRLKPAFEDCLVTYATVHEGYRSQVPHAAFHVIPDSHRADKSSLLPSILRTLVLLHRLRPDVIVSTGAAPGYFAVRFGRWFRARTVWIDSIANAEKLSLSGQMLRRHADLWLTQWPHLAREDGPQCLGNVL